MQFRSASLRPRRGSQVMYTPSESGELNPGRSPISTTAKGACSASPIASPTATRPCSTTHTGANRQPAMRGRTCLYQMQRVPLYGQGREPIRDHEDNVVFPRGEQRRRILAQRAAQVRPPQVGGPVPGLALQRQRRQSASAQFIAQHAHVDGRMDCIACPRMRQLKVEQRTCRQAHPGTFEADPRRGVTAQRLARRVRHLHRRQIRIGGAWSVFRSRLTNIESTRETPVHSTATAHHCAARPQTPAPAASPRSASGTAHRETMCFDNAASRRPPRARP